MSLFWVPFGLNPIAARSSLCQSHPPSQNVPPPTATDLESARCHRARVREGVRQGRPELRAWTDSTRGHSGGPTGSIPSRPLSGLALAPPWWLCCLQRHQRLVLFIRNPGCSPSSPAGPSFVSITTLPAESSR